MNFNWKDPFLLETQLNKDGRLIRDSANAYAQGKLQLRVTDVFASEQTDPQIFAEMGLLGLLGTTIPEEYGGHGANYDAYGPAAREVERAGSGYQRGARLQRAYNVSQRLISSTDPQPKDKQEAQRHAEKVERRVVDEVKRRGC